LVESCEAEVVPGEHDLDRMLASLDVEQRDGLYTFVCGDWPSLRARAHAIVQEREGPTYVVAVADAAEAGAPVDFVAAWLTLTVWSSLDSIGLTAAVSAALAEARVPCNVIAGYHHDHLLVPVGRVDEALRVLRKLSST
jgi:hypothetical protein